MSGVSGAPDVSGPSGAPHASGAPDVSGGSGSLDVSGAPDASGAPDVSGGSGASDVSGASGQEHRRCQEHYMYLWSGASGAPLIL